MAIVEGDIKLLKSQVLDDVPEGGGWATAQAVVDGQSNNLFPDTSELDRTYGRISLRKTFPAVDTPNVDTYYGAHAIIARPPDDPRVSACLFTTGSWSDTRLAAAAKLESYLAMGTESRYVLFGNHLAGQRSVQVHCAKSVASPGIGDVLALAQRDNASAYQYVRVTRIISRTVDQVFTDQAGDYLRDVLVLEISDPLRLGFPGATAQRYTADWYAPQTRVHLTYPADATSYYGVSPLETAADLGDLVIRVESIYQQLVPSALSEAPIVDARLLSTRDMIVPISGAPALSFGSTLTANPGAVVVRYFGSAIARGSLSIAVAGIALVDDANGALVPSGGFSGSVDYAAGSVAISRSTGMSSLAATYAASHAAVVASAGHSESTPISVGNRGYTYVKLLSPAPAPGSVAIEYMALGKWYRLDDDGAGALSGDDGVGTGTVNYASGSMVVTLAALPDVNTALLFTWGTPAHYTPRVGTSVFQAPSIRTTVPGGGLQPGSVVVRYLAGGVTKTVSDNAAGSLSGHGTGWVDYAAGTVALRPSVLPDADSAVEVDYRQGLLETATFPAGGASTNFSVPHAILPKSLSIEFVDGAGGRYLVRDDGANGLQLVSATFAETGAGRSSSVTIHLDGHAVGEMSTYQADALEVTLSDTSLIGGTVNYTTGAVALGSTATVLATTQQRALGPNQETRAWQTQAAQAYATGSVLVKYRRATDSAGAVQTHTVSIPGVALDLSPAVGNSLVPGSIRLTLGGSVYVDRQGGMVRDPSASTNSGMSAGTVNYVTGQVNLTAYSGGGSPAASVAALTRRGVWQEWQFRARVSGAPVQPASVALRANRASDSGLVTVSSNLSGVLSGTGATGAVDYQFGILSLNFGSWVADAGLTAEEKAQWWYDPARVVSGQIFRPMLMLSDTALYNAVAVSNLPLSAAVLGLDPVRLPVDGRVAVLRKGDVLVIHHTALTSPATVSNGQTINLGRVRIARVRVIGANGATIPSGYTTDLDAGTVTFANVSGYSQPVRIEHRIEDMALCSDAQINGDLTLTRPLTHDFPLGSYCSSALILGDLHARVSHLFDQQTWSGAWADSVLGSASPASYNAVVFPPAIDNHGAIQERWLLLFTNTTQVNVIGETVGQVLTGASIANPIAPINPATGTPYFTLAAAGWGAGWAAGNCLRINTVAAHFPVWVARTVLQGPATLDADGFTIGVRGDIDAP